MTRRLMNEKEFYRRARKISEHLIVQFDRVQIREELVGVYRSLLAN
jgi:hypothetical protein